MNLPSKTAVVVVGAGQAGLTMSWYLGQASREHLVLDRRSSLGGGWQDRWNAFRLVSPNWTTSFPGDPYAGSDPNGFMPRHEIAARVANYAERIGAPVLLETEVRRLTARTGGGFGLDTSHGLLEAGAVVVATGSFHVPRIPALATKLPRRLTQLHSHAYRNVAALPDGAVLVVGSGQSGVQIAEELREAGREVYLSVGSAGRVPRRYRGQDFFYWLAMLAIYGEAVGVPLPTVDNLPDPRLKLAANPQLSGHHGGHDIDLRRMAAEGLRLIGRIDTVNHERLRLRNDLSANLAHADAIFDERYRKLFDDFITVAGIDAQAGDTQSYPYEPPPIGELNLLEAGISTVIWATGYALDFSWIDMPIFDNLGFPEQRRGVTSIPGLYFLGLLWQHTQASATLRGPALDGQHLAEHLGLRIAPLEPPPPLSPPPALRIHAVARQRQSGEAR
jgi:putative flavoprotein involved in K+ transport